MSGCTLLYFSDSSAAAPKARHADRIRLGKLGIGATKRGRRFGGDDALPRYKGLPPLRSGTVGCDGPCNAVERMANPFAIFRPAGGFPLERI
jgi:hypothetical protein